MTNVQPRLVENSISPLSHDVTQPGASVEMNELVKNDDLKPVESDDKSEIVEPPPEPAPDEENEARRPRIGRRPMAPTKADIDEHFPLHLNYRSWCEHCRSGKGRQSPHIVEPHDRERLGITFNADYAFMTPEEK